ncbi:hypothetical protein [Methylobacterium nodulans]|uniref:Uncharacterized protein n=1 Tax=Methylobacterium nodulans (strain LMG 21967 / CNCM I-2342 / ORS 2060) TaxID=460265 RepID=B8ILU2_METNO|nr:hypothetical protein [Methylobacterium nodulans]ACL62067.1 hypothetical protein Mnod_7328 [Methylobacterium nodulans ORS 2060]
MYVRMLTAMAGDAFSHLPGDLVDVPEATAEAWKTAGLAEDPPKAAASEKAAKDLRARVAELEAQLAEALADRDALRQQIEVLAAANADLTAQLAPAA